MTESLISRGFLFHKSVNPAIIVNPVKAPFNFPSLVAVPLFFEFLTSDTLFVIRSSCKAGFNPTLL